MLLCPCRLLARLSFFPVSHLLFSRLPPTTYLPILLMHNTHRQRPLLLLHTYRFPTFATGAPPLPFLWNEAHTHADTHDTTMTTITTAPTTKKRTYLVCCRVKRKRGAEAPRRPRNCCCVDPTSNPQPNDEFLVTTLPNDLGTEKQQRPFLSSSN